MGPTPRRVRVENLADPPRGRYAWGSRRPRQRGNPTMATQKKKKKAPRPARKRPAPRPQRQPPESLRPRSRASSFTGNDPAKSVAWCRDVLGFGAGEHWAEGGTVRGIRTEARALPIIRRP